MYENMLVKKINKKWKTDSCKNKSHGYDSIENGILGRLKFGKYSTSKVVTYFFMLAIPLLSRVCFFGNLVGD